MKKEINKYLKIASNQIKKTIGLIKKNPLVGFLILNIILVVVKTYFEYFTSFKLGIETPFQAFIALINPIPTALIFFSIALYFKGRIAYWIILFFNLVQSIWLFANILYYREFSDFLSTSILSSGSSVGENLTKSISGIIRPIDFIVFIDIIILAILLLTKKIKTPKNNLPKKRSFLTTVLGFVLVVVNFGIASVDRSGLLSRSFDNNYLVKYLGLNEYAVVNAYQSYTQAQSRDNASAKQLAPIKKWIADNGNSDNVSYFGTQSGKNVVVFHLESFQQFLIDYKVEGQEVTPNLNAFFHDQHTLAFDNFYNQVGQGKTSDAESMLDTGLFGLPSGSSMVKYGTNNTFEGVPAFLHTNGYTTAAFHADVPSFWNRNNAYKNWGYDFFFSKDFYSNASQEDLNLGYGMLDKPFLQDTAEYLEQLPQPFYAKLITVTNHYPYLTNGEIKYAFPQTQTGDKTVDSYVQTAHYVDTAFGEFMNYLKATGIYDNTLVYVYGDHYGISENHQDAIAKLLGKDSVSEFDLAQWQKVPFMIHSSDLQGGINHTLGGEIDVVPTLYDLLGVNDDNMTIFGHDLLSSENKQIVAFRNGDWITQSIVKRGDQYFDGQTGQIIKNKNLTTSQKTFIKETNKYVDTQLDYSDQVVTGDLLRFDTTGKISGFDPKTINYQKSATDSELKQLEESKPSSIKARNGGKTTISYYITDELMTLDKVARDQKISELKADFQAKYPQLVNTDK